MTKILNRHEIWCFIGNFHFKSAHILFLVAEWTVRISSKLGKSLNSQCHEPLKCFLALRGFPRLQIIPILMEKGKALGVCLPPYLQFLYMLFSDEILNAWLMRGFPVITRLWWCRVYLFTFMSTIIWTFQDKYNKRDTPRVFIRTYIRYNLRDFALSHGPKWCRHFIVHFLFT